MPYTEQHLPFARRSHTSYRAAVEAAPSRPKKTARYLTLLREHGPMTDHQVATETGWPLSSVCSIRNGVRDQIVPRGHGVSPYGKVVHRWGLASAA